MKFQNLQLHEAKQSQPFMHQNCNIQSTLIIFIQCKIYQVINSRNLKKKHHYISYHLENFLEKVPEFSLFSLNESSCKLQRAISLNINTFTDHCIILVFFNIKALFPWNESPDQSRNMRHQPLKNALWQD